MTDQEVEVISHLSRMIWASKEAAERERTYPGSDPDKMDDYIKFHENRVDKLRTIRRELEDLLTQQT